MGWTVLIPFLQTIFSQQLAKFCPTPASGQREDPQAELQAHLVSAGASQFKPESLAQARPKTLQAVKLSNRHILRTDPEGRQSKDFIELPRGHRNARARNSALDGMTTNYWLHVLKAPPDHVKAGFAAGVMAKAPDAVDDDDE